MYLLVLLCAVLPPQERPFQPSSRDGRGVFEGLDCAARDTPEVVNVGEVSDLDSAATRLSLQKSFIHKHVIFRRLPDGRKYKQRAYAPYH